MKYRLRWPFYFDPPLTEMERGAMVVGFVSGLVVHWVWSWVLAVVMSLGGG